MLSADISPLMWGVLIIGGGVCIVAGVVAGLAKMWKERERRDGLR
jgi:hypothetical protein